MPTLKMDPVYQPHPLWFGRILAARHPAIWRSHLSF